jgi:hypothetical protein
MADELEECKTTLRKIVWDDVNSFKVLYPKMAMNEIYRKVSEEKLKGRLAPRTVETYYLEEKAINIESPDQRSGFTTMGTRKDRVMAPIPPEKRKEVIAEAKKEGGRVTAKKLEKAAVKVGAKKARNAKEKKNNITEVPRVNVESFKENKGFIELQMSIISPIENIENYIKDITKNTKCINGYNRKGIIDRLKNIQESLSNLIKRLEV